MIAIIGFSDLHVMQFLYKYTSILDDVGVEYDVIYWNRSGVEFDNSFKGNYIAYQKEMNTYKPFHKKILSFFGYRNMVKKVLKSNKYDKVIVLTSQTAVALYDILTSKYKGKYIYDYRDITKELSFPLYKKVIIKLFNNAEYVMISSMGFLDKLKIKPSDKFIMAHNTRDDFAKIYKCKDKQSYDKIRIVYWGMVRQVKYIKNICDIFANDDRFELVFHGEGYIQELINYCTDRGYNNIKFTGKYLLNQIPSFIKTTDILNCIYENDEKTKPTLAVKFYDAIKYELPMLVNKNSYLDKYTEDVPSVMSIDIFSEDVKDSIYNWYKEIEHKKIHEDYAVLRDRIINDDLVFKNTLLKFIYNDN